MKYYWNLLMFKLGFTDWAPYKPTGVWTTPVSGKYSFHFTSSNEKVTHRIKRIKGDVSVTLPKGITVDESKLSDDSSSR